MERVGKYQLEEKLGEGGFGRVWKAFDSDLEVWRALKEPYDQSPELEAELKEARVQAQLDHPGLVRILGTERIDGRFFLVTEYVEGCTLRDWLRQRSEIDLAAADAFLTDILAGLAHAHQHGIVHLDLKPENIFVTADGQIKIGDFGLARSVDRTMVTMTAVQGTLHYMAPEQLDGKAGPSVDLWALGAIAYELYTGQFAVGGETQGQILRNVAEGAVRDLGELPAERREWVASLLQRDPEQRVASAEQALAALQELTGVSTTTTVITQVAGPRWGLWLAPALVWAVLVGVAGVAYGVWSGILIWPAAERLFVWTEAAPESQRPDAGFFALSPQEQLDRAWEHADAGDSARAHGAAAALVDAEVAAEVRAEALYLRAVLRSRYLERPWHAVADLRRYQQLHPDGKHALVAGMLLAELYVGLERVAEGVGVLDALVRGHPRHPMLGEVLALVDRCEEMVRQGAALPLQRRQGVWAFLGPNNVASLGLCGLGLAVGLGPGLLWFVVGVVPAGNARNPLPWLLLVGFLVSQALQVYLNQASSHTAQQELLQLFDALRGAVGN